MYYINKVGQIVKKNLTNWLLAYLGPHAKYQLGKTDKIGREINFFHKFLIVRTIKSASGCWKLAKPHLILKIYQVGSLFTSALLME